MTNALHCTVQERNDYRSFLHIQQVSAYNGFSGTYPCFNWSATCVAIVMSSAPKLMHIKDCLKMVADLYNLKTHFRKLFLNMSNLLVHKLLCI